MAVIEELESQIKPFDGVRDQLGIARVVKINRFGYVYYQCRICQENFDKRIWSKRDYRDHVQLCKSVHHRIVKDNNRQNSKKMRRALDRLDAIYEGTTYRNHIYFHQNESHASGIGEFASNCATFVGSQIIRILENGLTQYKIDTMSFLFSFLDGCENEEIARDLLEHPDASFISSINDILLIYNQSRYSASELLHRLGDLIWYPIMSDVTVMGSNGDGDGFHLLDFSPEIFKQLLAIARLLALSNNDGPDSDARGLKYDNLIIIPILWGCTDTIGKEIEMDYRQKLYNTQKRTFDFKETQHLGFAWSVYRSNDGLSFIFPASQNRDSPLDFGWQTFLRREIALQLFRKHIDLICAPDNLEKPNFGIMLYISPYLVTVDSDEDCIRSGIPNLTQKFLSATYKYLRSGYGFHVRVFRDIFEAISLSERFNCNTEVWNSTISQWLTKNPPYFISVKDTVPLMQNYWKALQGFRESSKIEKFSQKCQTILNNPLVLKDMAEWLGISGLEICELAWEDLDPDNDWNSGFWHASSPPKGVETKYLEYCSYCKGWRIIKEKYRLKIELMRLYGFTQRLWKTYAGNSWRFYSRDVDVFEPGDNCWDDHFPPIDDWRICLQWEEREIIIKDMIKNNLRKTRPDIMNRDNVIAQRGLDSSTKGTNTSDAAKDEVVHALDSEETQIWVCSPDSASDIYPSYDVVYIHQ